jgi:hypothetical protein
MRFPFRLTDEKAVKKRCAIAVSALVILFVTTACWLQHAFADSYRSARAAMLISTVADAAKPTISVGTAVWSVVPAPPGKPQGLGVKAEINIPDLKMHASMILRKNFDSSLPASHTIDLRFSFGPGSPVKGIKDIALPLMRRDGAPMDAKLFSVRVKISDNYFLVGLVHSEAYEGHNLKEIAERSWFDIPMELDDGHIAKLTFEKGADGNRIISDAIAAWNSNIIYPGYPTTRNFVGSMTRKLSVTVLRNSRHLLGTSSRRKPSVASAKSL